MPTSILAQPRGYGLHPINASYNKNMLKYTQKTGRLYRFVGGSWNEIGVGYSGNGAGLNNHSLEDTPNVGPCPVGLWSLGFPFQHATKGPNCFRLTPLTYRGPRFGFMMHGDNKTPEPNDASDGCIVMGPTIRQSIADPKEDYLLVEAY